MTKIPGMDECQNTIDDCSVASADISLAHEFTHPDSGTQIQAHGFRHTDGGVVNCSHRADSFCCAGCWIRTTLPPGGSAYQGRGGEAVSAN